MRRAMLLLGLMTLLMGVLHKKGVMAPVVQPRAKVSSVLRKEAKKLGHAAKERLAHLIVELSHRYKMDPLLILAVMKVESHFDPMAHSHRGAMGLMQVRPIALRQVAHELGVAPKAHPHLTSMDFNVRVGVHYLAGLIKRFKGDVAKALMAYNQGPTVVARNYQGIGVPYSGYQKKVLETYSELKF